MEVNYPHTNGKFLLGNEMKLLDDYEVDPGNLWTSVYQMRSGMNGVIV